MTTNYLDELLSRIESSRDRYFTWIVSTALLSLVFGIWCRAPGLAVSLPSAGGASISINVGYILVFGIPVIASALVFSFTHLQKMHRYQEILCKELQGRGTTLNELQMLQYNGKLQSGKTDSWLVRRSSGFRDFLIGSMIFGLPVLGQLFIVDAYSSLKIFSVSQTTKSSNNAGNIHANRLLIDGIHGKKFGLFELDLNLNADRRVFLEDSSTEQACALIFSDPNQSVSQCPYIQYPYMYPLANTVINTFFLLFSFLITIVSFRYYFDSPELPETNTEKQNLN